MKIYGEDSINFANLIYNSTYDQINYSKKYISKIDNNVVITKRTNSGFEAEISDLDLSFFIIGRIYDRRK